MKTIILLIAALIFTNIMWAMDYRELKKDLANLESDTQEQYQRRNIEIEECVEKYKTLKSNCPNEEVRANQTEDPR